MKINISQYKNTIETSIFSLAKRISLQDNAIVKIVLSIFAILALVSCTIYYYKRKPRVLKTRVDPAPLSVSNSQIQEKASEDGSNTQETKSTSDNNSSTNNEVPISNPPVNGSQSTPSGQSPPESFKSGKQLLHLESGNLELNEKKN